MTAGVPEPGTIGLLGLEGMMLIASRPRRRSARRRGKRTG
ncbi:MAG: PEP-CTERM sorting domain-containing protein [Phycisphaerae bacterium]